MRTFLFAVLLAGCGVPTGDDSTATAEQALCNTPLNCPGTPPPSPPPVDPYPDRSCAGVTGTLTASPQTVRYGTKTTLTWAVSSSKCGDPLLLDGAPVLRSGSRVIDATSPLHLLTLGTRELARVSLTLTVANPTRITANTPVQRGLFMYAITNPGQLSRQTVLLQQDVELDLTDIKDINIAGGVTIASEIMPAPGRFDPWFGRQRPSGRDSNHPGPRIFNRTLADGHFFVVNGNDITLRGFRLEGPDQNVSDKLGGGITMNARKGIEIDNLEVSGWSGTAIGASNEGYYAIVANVTDIRIHDCFIHHNQHGGAVSGFGYGVSIGSGARATIEHNVFDFNRHSVTSDGQLGTEYVAFENLILKGGGYHEWDYWLLPDITWTTHAFDVHGTEDCGGDKNCGAAGNRYVISRNSFQFDRGYDFKLRGTPEEYVLLKENLFPHPSETAAVDWTFHAPRPLMMGNIPNRDTFGQYGVCDFDGDGQDDLFQATGRTWWFASAGRFQWTYLSSHDEQLSELGLGDFDHDGKCDVFRVGLYGWEISSAGGSTWTPVPGTYTFPLEQLAFHDFDGDGFTDVFRRDPGYGQWFAYDTKTGAQRALNSSGQALSTLRFGDFDNDGRTDIATVNGGMWKWSRSGTTSWDILNPLYSDLSNVLIGNFDDVPGDDIVRRVEDGSTRARLQLSPGARGAWVDLPSVDYDYVRDRATLGYVWSRATVVGGRFVRSGQDSLLTINLGTRSPRQFTSGQKGFVQHSFYEY